MTTFESLRDNLLSEGKLFEDVDFPAAPSSITPGDTYPEDWLWKRPKEICANNPQFIVEGVSRFDLCQGTLGDCWFVASAAVVATKKDLFKQVVPSDQGFEEGRYAGMFHFFFWRFGKWTEVIIDDRLPVDVDGELRFAYNRAEPNEFWGALLEKAYAKIHGSYTAIWSGHIQDALVDFTGGISERFNLQKNDKLPENLYEILMRSFDAGSLIGVGIRGDPGTSTEEELTNGLYKGHAYSVTNLLETKIQGWNVKLVRLRNPWGKCEWNGSWSDGSAEWDSLSKEDKQEIGLVFEDDGEFWMSFDDMKANFNMLDIVHLGPKTFSRMGFPEECVVWKESQYHGQWVKGVNAGGAGILGANPEVYYQNPQYFMKLTTPDEGDVAGECTCIVSLMQKDYRRRKLDPTFKQKTLILGLDVHLVKDGNITLLNADTFVDKAHLKRQYSTRTPLREISVRLTLDPGLYCIIPNTFKANQEGSFVLRIFTYAKADTTTIEDPNGPIPPKEAEGGTVDQPLGTLPSDMYLEFAGSDGEVDARDLRDLLAKLSKTQLQDSFVFGVESCRTLLSLHDDLRCGTLDYDQMSKLWDEMLLWRSEFKKFDKDKSGTVDTFELKEIFRSIGYSLSFDTVSTIAVRYGGKERKLFFEDFAVCLAKTMAMFTVFEGYSKSTPGEARLNVDEWLKTTLFY